MVLTIPLDVVCETPEMAVVVGRSGLLPPIIFLIGTDIAAIGGAERIDVSDGDDSAADDDDDGGVMLGGDDGRLGRKWNSYAYEDRLVKDSESDSFDSYEDLDHDNSES